MRYLILASLVACSGSPVTTHSTAGHSASDAPRGPSPLLVRDSRDARLPLNFADPSLRGLEWRCFDMQWTTPAGIQPIGRCYRMTVTCERSRALWSQYYATAPCAQQRHAACLRGKERSKGTYFAICYTRSEDCQRAHTELLDATDAVGFISPCEILD